MNCLQILIQIVSHGQKVWTFNTRFLKSYTIVTIFKNIENILTNFVYKDISSSNLGKIWYLKLNYYIRELDTHIIINYANTSTQRYFQNISTAYSITNSKINKTT